jgi:PAS domain-containing protein
MALQKKTIRLLILEDSQNEAERLVSLFRNAGQATRVHRLTSSDDLAEALKQTWDLLINAPQSENLDPSEAINAIRRQAKDIPIIQLTAGNDAEAITEALMLGAQDALPQGEDEWLLLVANRELANLEERRARRSAEVALREAEKRCQLLLDSSVDAIAYVHDGMHIYANRAYLELFGYDDVDQRHRPEPFQDLPEELPEHGRQRRTGLWRRARRWRHTQDTHALLAGGL